MSIFDELDPETGFTKPISAPKRIDGGPVWFFLKSRLNEVLEESLGTPTDCRRWLGDITIDLLNDGWTIEPITKYHYTATRYDKTEKMIVRLVLKIGSYDIEYGNERNRIETAKG